jgi:hypothetical protein
MGGWDNFYVILQDGDFGLVKIKKKLNLVAANKSYAGSYGTPEYHDIKYIRRVKVNGGDKVIYAGNANAEAGAKKNFIIVGCEDLPSPWHPRSENGESAD